MDSLVDERDLKILENNRYTFLRFAIRSAEGVNCF